MSVPPLVVALIASACTAATTPDEPSCPEAATVVSSDAWTEIRAEGDGIEAGGLLFPTAPIADGQRASFPPGAEVKIVWRATGEGDLDLVARGPSGELVEPAFGPQAHMGSNWDRPGEEWGSGWVFPEPGCWTIVLDRGGSRVEIVVEVAAGQGGVG